MESLDHSHNYNSLRQKLKVLRGRGGRGGIHSLLLVVDLSQTLEMNPCASWDLSPDTQKPDTTASHSALHPATCDPHSQLDKGMTKEAA